MLNKLQNEWRSPIIFGTMAAMLLSMFFSRAALSASMVFFIIFSFFHKNIGLQLRNYVSSPLLLGISLLFFLPLFSGLWSGNKQEWLEILKIKLPLFLFPLAFASPFTLHAKQWLRLIVFFVILILAGTVWSMILYAADFDAINSGYLKANSMITPLKNDRIRFSLLVSIAALLSGRMFFTDRSANKKKAIWWLLLFAWFVCFLHILAVRTGLVAFYSVLFVAGILLSVRKKSRWKGIGLLCILVLLPVIAYYSMPSFQNRVRFFVYEFDFFKRAAYIPSSNDAVRMASWKTGAIVMNENMPYGVGFGDISRRMNERYPVLYPGMKEADMILPANEWLIYGVGAGLAGLLVLTLVVLLPFFISTREAFLWRLSAAIFGFSFAVDIGLEVQFGVFIYVFITLWWWKWLTAKNI